MGLLTMIVRQKLISTFTACLFVVISVYGASSVSAQEYAGDSCRVSATKQMGTCKLAQECPEAFASGRPDICSYSGKDSIICCPRDSSTATPSPPSGPGNRIGDNSGRTQRISEMKCREYSKFAVNTFSVSPLILDPEIFDFEVPNCEFSTPLIVDGERTKVGEFPHMAALGWKKDNGKVDYNCGGVLISEEFVLTAAHCSGVTGNPPDIVRLGEQNLVEDNDNAQPEDFSIREIIVHPEYRRPMAYNDISLLRLNRKVSLTKMIRPACLWPASHLNFTEAVATGWGLIEFASEKSDELLKAPLSIYPPTECKPFFEKNRKIPSGIIDSQLCAGNRGGRQDTCQGDSGGPLQVVNAGNKCIFHIIGLTSFGKSCGLSNSPGVYTRVSYYLDWIERTVWPNV